MKNEVGEKMTEKEYFRDKIVEIVQKIDDCALLAYVYRLLIGNIKGG